MTRAAPGAPLAALIISARPGSCKGLQQSPAQDGASPARAGAPPVAPGRARGWSAPGRAGRTGRGQSSRAGICFLGRPMGRGPGTVGGQFRAETTSRSGPVSWPLSPGASSTVCRPPRPIDWARQPAVSSDRRFRKALAILLRKGLPPVERFLRILARDTGSCRRCVRSGRSTAASRAAVPGPPAQPQAHDAAGPDRRPEARPPQRALRPSSRWASRGIGGTARSSFAGSAFADCG